MVKRKKYTYAEQPLMAKVFIKKAHKVHDFRYIYSEVRYEHEHVKVNIRCLVHGIFEISPRNHLDGYGCPSCFPYEVEPPEASVSIYRFKLDTENFIKLSKNRHGGRFNYDKTNYTGLNNPVIITCEVHGDISINSYRHLSGRGCNQCTGNLRISPNTCYTKNPKDRFIDKAIKQFNGKYDYSHVIYIDSSTLVNITCPIHGSFLRTPSEHLNGFGCHECRLQIGRRVMKYSNFIKRASHLFNNKYNYTDTNFRGRKFITEIECKEHGKFRMLVTDHLKGKGCPKCES